MSSKKIYNIAIIFVFCISCNGQKQSNDFSEVWNYSYTKPAEGLSLVNTNPTVYNDHILISPDEQLTLIDLKSGKKSWSLEFDNSPYISTEEFLTDLNILYVKEVENDRIYAIDLENGTIIWQKNSPSEFYDHSNDGMDQLYLYVTGRYDEIYRYSKNGKLNKTYDISNYDIEDRSRSIRIFKNQLIFSQFFRKEKLSHDSGRILSIHKETEEVLWEYRTDNGGFIFEPILLEDEIIYAGVTDGPGEFVALNVNNGEVIWKTLGIIGQSYTLTDSMVLVNGGVTLRALDKFTGAELWNTGLAFGGGYGQDNIAFLDGYVYHSHSGRLYVLDVSNGEIVHTEERSPDGSPFGLLTAAEGKVFVQTDVALYAYTAWE
tara:strand:- start:2350 stop:3474 length:1125 start_codon:yes stop_codon:yes gene_type:complete